MATACMRSILPHKHPLPLPSSSISRILCNKAPLCRNQEALITLAPHPPRLSFAFPLIFGKYADNLPILSKSSCRPAIITPASSSSSSAASPSRRCTTAPSSTSSSSTGRRSGSAPSLRSSSPLQRSSRVVVAAALSSSGPSSSKNTVNAIPLKKTRSKTSKTKLKKELEINAPVSLEDSLESTPELEELLKQLEHDGPLAVKLAVEGREELKGSETIELSIVICNDAYIQDLNNEWRGEDHPTDVLSFPQDQPPGFASLWLLGDVIVSVDTAKRQAQERGHTLLDEVRILLVHGLLHVLGYDHEEGPEASEEMEKEELRILQGLGWNSQGLITSANGTTQETHSYNNDIKSKGAWKRKPVFKVLLCDMDGTLLNSQSKITEKTAAALKEAVERGVQVIVATGKTRPAVITACQPVGLVGEKGVVSEFSPGVFLQGLLVYGHQEKVVHNQLLSQDVCIKAFQYSLKHKQPLLGFSGDRIVTLFDDPLVEQLHTIYMEPKAEVVPSIDYLIQNFQIQKLLFPDTSEGISKVIRPYWSGELGNLARVVQAQADMLEIIPVESSKGRGVEILLKELGVDPDDVMAIGDGENDIEMLKLVGWGVAMGNGAPQTLAVADAQVASNNEDGVVEAVERFLLS